jgi:hypothetical protein
MKNIFFATLLFVLLAPSLVLAAWTDDFLEEFDRFGIDRAVENVLDKDVPPNEILTFIISNKEKFQIRVSLKALYCAGVDRDIVAQAADQLGIAVEDVSVALEESIAECGSALSLSDRDLMDESATGANSSLPDRQGTVVTQGEAQAGDVRRVLEKPRSQGSPASASVP